MKRIVLIVLVSSFVLFSCTGSSASQKSVEPAMNFSADDSDFVLLTDVVPDVILEIRYYSTYNFVGARIDGYHAPVALCTKEAAAALAIAADTLRKQGYRLKVFDAYRPQEGVDHFMRWARVVSDTAMKRSFYPRLAKNQIIPQGYVASHSGHTRGSTLDLTLFDEALGHDVDMGGAFDYFGVLSHPDCRDITDTQYANRMILRKAMMYAGFKPLNTEWWHFTLRDEPFPDTYFTFPVDLPAHYEK